KRTAILVGVREVATAITAATVTTVAVFLPIALVSDITGELFRPFALTVTIALLASLFVSLTIVPVLAYWFLKAPKEAHKHAAAPLDDEDELDRPTLLQRGYLPILEWTLTRRWLTVAAAVLVLVGTGALVPLLPTNFIGDSGQNTVTVRQTLEPGSNLAAVDRAAQRVEDELLAIDGVDTVQVSLGSGDGSGLA